MMKRLKKWWKPVLLGMVLAMILTGAAGARPMGGPLKVVAVSAADCIPRWDHDWESWGYYLQMSSGHGNFNCPVHFPEYGTKRVRIIKMYVFDNTGVYNVQAVAYRTSPTAGSQDFMHTLMTTSDSAVDPQVHTRSWGQLSNEVVTQSHAMYMRVSITGPSALLRLYGFRIWYV